jgi:hypothetical protein
MQLKKKLSQKINEDPIVKDQIGKKKPMKK